MSLSSFSGNDDFKSLHGDEQTHAPSAEKKAKSQGMTKAEYQELLKAIEKYQEKVKLLGTPEEQPLMELIHPDIKNMSGAAQIKMSSNEVLNITRGRSDEESSNR